VGVFTARAAVPLLDHRPALLRLVEKICEERDSLAERLAAIPGVRPFPSRANFVLMRTERPGAWIARELLRRDIGVRFYPDSPSLANFIRVTVGTPEENREFLSALQEILAG